jgi:hypothetical protein
VARKLAKAEALIDKLSTSTAKKARKIRQSGRRLLRQAGTAARRASKGKKPKLSGACAAVLSDAASRVARDL